LPAKLVFSFFTEMNKLNFALSTKRWLAGGWLLIAVAAVPALGQTCVYRFDPQNATIPAVGGSGSFTVLTTGNQVCPYAGGGSPANWIIPSPNNINAATSSGYYLFSYTVAPNASTDARTAGLTIAGTGTAGYTNYVIQFLQKPTNPTQVFDDVPLTSPYADYINLMRSLGITAGCATSPLRYCPTELVTRGQMAVFLVRSVLNTDTFTYSTTPYFTDVPSTHPQFKYIQKIRELGYTVGCTADGTAYCPSANVTRGQMALFLMRADYGLAAVAAGLKNSTTPYFTDVPANDPYFNVVQKLRDYGITSGCGPNIFCLNDNITREQMAVLLIRALKTPTFDQ
jgi:hypothetical protein